MRRGTGKLVLTIVAVVVGGTILNKKTGGKVPGFN
jgi:hypothetical protein